MKQKADRKKAIRRLTALSSRLQMLGAALALVGVVSIVQLFRTEVFAKPEPPTESTQIETTEATMVHTTTMVPETSAEPERSAVKTTPAAAESTEASTPGQAENGNAPNAGVSDITGGTSNLDDADRDDNEANKDDLDMHSFEIAAEEGGQLSQDTNSGDDKGNLTSDFKSTEPSEPKRDLAIQDKAEVPRWNPPFSNWQIVTAASVPDITDPPEKPEKPVSLWLILAIVSDGLLILDLIAVAMVQKKLKKLRKGPDVIPTTERIPWHAVPPEIGKVHGIGGRDYQQDSLGHTRVLNGSGILAIVADGMGGLSNGEQVSQQIVMDGLGYGAAMTGLSEGNPLLGMVGQINTNVNRMLGPEGIYKCGSTLIAVLVAQDQFHWVSVGDSRIYLYREGYVNQLNTDHDLFQQWMPEILAGTRSYVEAARNPDGRKLTSFIGMGELKYADYSRQPIDLRQGDRLVLVTDGVYGTVPPEQLADILKANPEVSDAAKVLERRIRDARMPHQDNYTALILGF